MALTDKLTSIAAAIREKGGTTEKLTLDAMPTAIANLPTGGGGEDLVPNPIVLSGKIPYTFAENKFKWMLENYGDRIETNNITDCGFMFSNTNLEGKTIPFDLNITDGANCEYLFNGANISLPDDYFLRDGMKGKIGKISYMFSSSPLTYIPSFISSTKTTQEAGSWLVNSKVEAIGDISLHIEKFTELFRGATYLRHIPNITLTNNNLHTYAYGGASNVFGNCFSLRTIPEAVLKKMYNTGGTSTYYWYLPGCFRHLYALDEVVGLSPITPKYDANAFNNTFERCYHLKRIVFDTQEDGTPYTAQWKNQTIDLSQYVGWAGYSNADRDITINYNSGITYDKEVVSQADYERLKDDPDWWSRNFMFSRFGHDAAVELINTLPDTEAYLVSQGASNNIVKFYSNAGNAIDGGSVSALTEEEIAVAAAKGWSIAYTTG